MCGSAQPIDSYSVQCMIGIPLRGTWQWHGISNQEPSATEGWDGVPGQCRSSRRLRGVMNKEIKEGVVYWESRMRTIEEKRVCGRRKCRVSSFKRQSP